MFYLKHISKKITYFMYLKINTFSLLLNVEMLMDKRRRSKRDKRRGEDEEMEKRAEVLKKGKDEMKGEMLFMSRAYT